MTRTGLLLADETDVPGAHYAPGTSRVIFPPGGTEMSDNPVTSRQPRSDAGKVRVSEQDRLGLSWVVEMYAMPRDQLVELLGTSESALANRLTRWRRAGWVEDDKLDGGPGWVWATRRGIELFGRHPYAPTAPSVGKLRHHRAVIEERRKVEEKNPMLLGFRSERELRYEFGQRFGAAETRNQHFSDGVLEMPGPGGGVVDVAFEVELTAKAYGRFAANVEATLGQNEGGAYWVVEHHGVRPLVERWLATAQPSRTIVFIDRETGERLTSQAGGTHGTG